MRDQAIGQPDLSLALAEPTQHVRRRWIIGLTLASLGMWMANQTPLQVMLALQLQDITPRHKIVALGVVTGVGAIASALATPVVGALSDRTAHSGRMRHRVRLQLTATCTGVANRQAGLGLIAVQESLHLGAGELGAVAGVDHQAGDRDVLGWVEGDEPAVGLLLALDVGRPGLGVDA